MASAKKPRFGNVGLPSREPGLRLRCKAGQPERGVGKARVQQQTRPWQEGLLDVHTEVWNRAYS